MCVFIFAVNISRIKLLKCAYAAGVACCLVYKVGVEVKATGLNQMDCRAILPDYFLYSIKKCWYPFDDNWSCN